MDLIIKSTLRKTIFNFTIEKCYNTHLNYVKNFINNYGLYESQSETVDMIMQKNNGYSLI